MRGRREATGWRVAGALVALGCLARIASSTALYMSFVILDSWAGWLGTALDIQRIVATLAFWVAVILLCRGTGLGRWAAWFTLATMLAQLGLGTVLYFQAEPDSLLFTRTLFGHVQLMGFAVTLWQRAGRGRALVMVVGSFCAMELGISAFMAGNQALVESMNYTYLLLVIPKNAALALLALLVARGR
jgi:hypothetical protein